MCRAQLTNVMEALQKNVLLKMSPYLVLILLEVFFEVTESASQAEINNHLELGKQFLARGQLSDALTHYHAAVEGDPNNYLTYFKRGTVYLALGKPKNALSDFDRVLELKPDFNAARLNRGNTHLKQANFDLAQVDFYNVLQMEPYNEHANQLYHLVEPTKEKRQYVDAYYQSGQFQAALQLLTEVIEVCPWAASLFDLRAEIHMENGDYLSAVADMRVATRLQTDNTAGYLKLSDLLYKLGHASDSLKSIRECLKMDPDHKECFAFYKKLKKVEKALTEAETQLEAQQFADCISSAEKVLKLEKETPMILFEAKRLLCACYSKDEQSTEAVSICTEALEINKEASVYCDRAEAYIQTEMFDDAIRDYKEALEIDPNHEKAKEGLSRAQKMQQQSERRDYYKILGVKRTATKKEIVKAYRKAAQKWHPDNYTNDEKMKVIAEKKFIDIAAAKEVLTDEEKRQQFDNGEDPLDPESGRSQGMPNFHHFQHGSPFQFRFHFN